MVGITMQPARWASGWEVASDMIIGFYGMIVCSSETSLHAFLE